MLWAPSQQEIIERQFLPTPPLPVARQHWIEAASWAECFWNRVIDDPRLSREFVSHAREARGSLSRLRSHEESGR